jgi:hypothetical protein
LLGSEEVAECFVELAKIEQRSQTLSSGQRRQKPTPPPPGEVVVVVGGEVVGVVVGGVVVGGAVGGVVTGGAVGGVVTGDGGGAFVFDVFGFMVLGVDGECGVDDVVLPCGTRGDAPAGFTTTTDHAPHLSVRFPCT